MQRGGGSHSEIYGAGRARRDNTYLYYMALCTLMIIYGVEIGTACYHLMVRNNIHVTHDIVVISCMLQHQLRDITGSI